MIFFIQILCLQLNVNDALEMNHFIKLLALPTLALTSAIAVCAEPSAELRTKISAIGDIKEVQQTPTNGMFAWLLEKNGKTLVIYNTPDNKSFIKGNIYNLETKKLISNQYAIDSLKYASPEFRDKVLGATQTTPKREIAQVKNNMPSNGYMNLKWTGKAIPEALSMIDDLKGAKEGKGLPQDTLYVFYDPSCTWCHTTYYNTRKYIEKGYTIKWLPTFARGKLESSIALNAAALQNPKKLNEVFERTQSALSAKPTEQQMKDLDRNLQFLFAYHNKVMPDIRPTVPFGLFLDKSSGKVTHIQGLSEKPILELLYGE